MCEKVIEYLAILDDYGYTFDWTTFSDFLKLSCHIRVTYEEMQMLRRGTITFNNGLITNRDEGIDPPYMSDEYRETREKIKAQVQKFNDDKQLSNKG